MSNLWSYGGFAPRGWSGFFGGFQIAVFAYVGIELVGTTSAETADPQRRCLRPSTLCRSVFSCSMWQLYSP